MDEVALQAGDMTSTSPWHGVRVFGADGPFVRVDNSLRDIKVEWAGVQAGIAAGPFAFGVAVFHDFDTAIREDGMRFGFGVRWAPRSGLVLDLAHESGQRDPTTMPW